jgi:hypothetical protein
METKKGSFIFDLLVSMTMRERLLRSHSSPRGVIPVQMHTVETIWEILAVCAYEISPVRVSLRIE